ncbi:GIY-YIG nuclease family protein [Candidatus Peregrinibacteria bacterium]|nr:GIY-YIG nuclease family protein [Candidatus Peregrinibacteria bacterium]
MKYFVYIIESLKDQSYYIGYTQGLDKRLAYHNEGRGRYTSKKSPWKLAYSEEYNSKKEAIIRERQIKNWKNRRLILKLISDNKKMER